MGNGNGLASLRMRAKGYVWWSIYVRTSSARKLKDVHLPPIEAALETLQFELQIINESENPGLFRLVTYQNLEGDGVLDLISPVLRRAYGLADGWSISGLGDLSRGELQHVMGGWSSKAPSNKPPALESMIFELQPGVVTGRTPDGGWQIDG